MGDGQLLSQPRGLPRHQPNLRFKEAQKVDSKIKTTADWKEDKENVIREILFSK